MAEAKKAAKFTAASLREMNQADRGTLLAEKRADLREAQRSLKAGEFANPRKIKELRREVALILTIENEPVRDEELNNSPSGKPSKIGQAGKTRTVTGGAQENK